MKLSKEQFVIQVMKRYYKTVRGGRAQVRVATRKEIEVLAEVAYDIAHYEKILSEV